MIKLKNKRFLAVLLVFGLLFSFSSAVPAASVTPVLMHLTVGNAAVEVAQVGCNPDYAFKVDNSAINGSYNTDHGNTITIINSDGYDFNWKSEWPVTCVLVKAGKDFFNVFFYPDGSYGDTGLYAAMNPNSNKPFEISHVSFGYNQPPVTPEDGTLIVNKILAGNKKPAGDTEFTITIGESTHTIVAGENTF
ncbi:MAG: hypothetical protein GX808_09225, partial [Syntrophomonadaceae bacterium]|nr:hypothetical protein [Syntrophomonadaceae bacterium]